MKFAGVLNRSDAKEWKLYWQSRGHSAVLESIVWHGLFACYLKLNRGRRKKKLDKFREV